MKINSKKENKKLTVSVIGTIDTVTAPEFMDYIKSALNGVEELVLDFKEVDYVSSAGLRVVLFAQKTMNSQGSMCLVNVNDDILETLELTGFTEFLTIN